MKNLLNLKKTPEPIIVEKIVLKKRSLFLETLKMLTIIVVSSGVIWAVSNADTVSRSLSPQHVVKNFSAMGYVDSVSATALTIVKAVSSDETGDNSFVFDISDIKKIETKEYTPLDISQIQNGDKVVVQGVDVDGVVSIKRIISFSENIMPVNKVAASTSTTNDSVASTTSTSTDKIASTTQTLSSSDFVTNFENASSTSTSTNAEASTTATSTESVGTSTTPVIDDATSSVATSTDTVGTSTSDSTTSPDQVVTPDTTPSPVPAPVTESTSNTETTIDPSLNQ